MGSVASAVGGVVNSMTGAGTQSGTDALNKSTRDVKKEFEDLLQRVTGLYSPYTTAGAGALPQLSEMTAKGFQPGDLTQDPGYKFALEQGLGAVQNRAGVQGSPFGGAAMAEMQKYATGLASQTYNDAFSRWQTQVGNLQQMAGLGANAAASQSGTMADLLASLAGVSSGNAQAQAAAQASQSDMF